MGRGWMAGGALGALALALGVSAAVAPSLPARAAEALDRAQVETIIREYLLANPELMVEVQAELEKKQKEEERLAHIATIQEAKADIFNAAYDGVVGNPDGKTTVVEFYDYNCGYCRHALSDMQALTKEDGDLRFVLKEFPILGPDSQKAHVVSMAFRKLMPEKYGAFHQELLGSQGRAGEATAIAIALKLGADETKLREEMKNPDIQAAFEKTYELANKLTVTGTPSYVVGSQIVYGALGADVLRQKIAEARACGTDSAC